jgi:hypothetical protein
MRSYDILYRDARVEQLGEKQKRLISVSSFPQRRALTLAPVRMRFCTSE